MFGIDSVIIKAVGLIIFVFSACIYGVMASNYEAEKCKHLYSVIKLLEHIKLRISCYKEPLSDILEGYNDAYLKKYGVTGETVDEVLVSIKTEKNSAIHRLENMQNLNLPNEVREHLASFTMEIGRGYIESQIKCCDYYIEKINKVYQKEISDLPNKKKLYHSSAVLMSILIIVIIL